ncbi:MULTISPECIES: enolase C-terminal domain-like protein [unclassified Nocardiopsis]|uniref:enolase C-terminal domain-like protein n=1 Tax=unclassified Nocardiopsis TaxID=2649073 RepID=UPI0018F8A5E9|nr:MULTISPECIES: enolase C-terminal domain-like protein [unclassified Nocardiopsis]MBQ1082911.1 O-succinylbenzoate synthase [Nocardiopsis sp. B62]
MTHTGAATVTRIVELELVRLRPSLAGRGSDGSVPVLVRVSDGQVSGWGEVSRATADQWEALVGDFAPALLDHAWRRPTDVADAFADLPWDPALSGALDTACWDLWSRQRSTPLAHALGGERTALTAGVTLPRQVTLESVVTEVNRRVGAGFRRIRLEIEPGWDTDVIRAVQSSFPFLVLQVDAGGRYTESTADLDALRSLDALGLLAIEDPFAAGDLGAHARLTAELRTPVALYRSLSSVDDLREAVLAEAGRAVNVDPARLGGLTEARRAVDRAVDAGWGVWCGSSAVTGVGRAATVALASLSGATLPVEMPSSSSRGRDLVIPPVRAHDGVVPVPLAESGLGHDVDRVALSGYTARTLVLDARSNRASDNAP